MRRRKNVGRFFVGDKACESAGSALSYAQGLASHWKDDPRSFYVRDALDKAFYRVDLDEDGVVRTYTL
jgi:hypothetical protein